MDLNELVNRVFALELRTKKQDYRAQKILADAAVTLVAHDLVDGGLFIINPTAPRILTTPTAAIIKSAMVPKPVEGDSFIVYIDNMAAHDVTLTAGSFVTVNSGIVNNARAAWNFRVYGATNVVADRLF